jgi:YegS/Rv2252/BmrU family lipid kinase
MGPFKVIVNPVAGRGLSGRMVPKLRERLSAHGLDYDLVCTSEPRDAVRLAGQALEAGFEAIVAVGGDGTAHEVVNGMLRHSGGAEVGTMATIPVGSGSDFANMLGMPGDLDEACARLARGQTCWVDVGLVTDSTGRSTYFDNTVGIGFDGVVTAEATKVRYLRGMALYLPVVLKTVFLTLKPPRVVIRYGDQELQQTALMITVCIGRREGGGFIIAPEACNDDGMFDVCVADNVPKLRMLALIPHFMQGTHVQQPCVAMMRTDQLSVTSEDDLIAHMDGEMLCTAEHELHFSLLPRRLRVIV